MEDTRETPETLPAGEVLQLARARGLHQVKDAGLPRPEDLPGPGWYETRAKGKNLYLYWRWHDPENGIKAKSLGRLN